MNEKTLEKITGLSRRQIIQLQKTVIVRKNKLIVGITYDYSADEVEEFRLAKIFKDCGYTYLEIKTEMENYKNNRTEVIEKAILKTSSKIDELSELLSKLNEMKKEVEDKK